MPSPRSTRWIGLALGLLTALFDFALLEVVDEGFGFTDRGRASWLMGLFAVTLAVLGYALGRLVEARRSAAADAAVIRAQLAALEASQRQLVEYETLASIGRLAAGVAHEVRNPLAVIRGAASLLLERLPEGEPDARRAGVFICEEVDRLDDFVRTLLDFARPLAARREPVPVAEVIARAELLAGPALAAAACDLEVDVGDVGEFSLDRDLVGQALAALIANASEAIADRDAELGPGGARGRVRVRARRIADALEVSVADDGPGIADEVRARLLEPFVTTRARGTGLGLPMSARIIRAHGGQLTPGDGGLGPGGRGAAFVVRIPPTSVALPEVRQ